MAPYIGRPQMVDGKVKYDVKREFQSVLKSSVFILDMITRDCGNSRFVGVQYMFFRIYTL